MRNAVWLVTVILACLTGCVPSKIEREITITNDGTSIETMTMIYHKADFSGELANKNPNAKMRGDWVYVECPVDKSERDLKALNGRLPLSGILGEKDPAAFLAKEYNDRCAAGSGKSSFSFPQFKGILREMEVTLTLSVPKKVVSFPTGFRKLTDYKVEWSGSLLDAIYYNDRNAAIEFEK